MGSRGKARAARCRTGARLVASLACTAVLAACGGSPSGAARPNLIVVLVDTLRADRMGFLGNERGLTPFMDGLAKRGAVFSRAYPTSSWTTPSVASLFTSQYPTQHGQTTLGSVLPDTTPTLAATLAEAGYATSLISGHGGFVPGLGLARGFEAARVVSGPQGPLAKGPGELVTAEAFAWLDGRSAAQRARPLFLYLHYMEPHSPYDAPPEILAEVLARRPDPARARTVAQRAADYVRDIRSAAGLPVRREDRDRSHDTPLGPQEIAQGVQDLYDAQVVTMDRRMAALFAGLEARGLLDDAVVVFTADHGQELMEHGKWGHGVTLFEESLRVPLLVVRTRRPAPARIATVVSLLDVAPTLLASAGVAAPATFEGRDLLPLIDAHSGVRGWVTAGWERLRPPPAEVAFSELYPLIAVRHPQATRALVRGDLKLVVDARNAATVFDLAADPGERAALPDHPQGQALHDRMQAFLAKVARAAAAPEVRELDEATRQRLRVLGYEQ